MTSLRLSMGQHFAAGLVWCGIALAWITVLTLHVFFHHSPLLQLLGWQLMLVAMMLPSAMPVFQAVVQLTPRLIERVAFMLPLWIGWTSFGLLILWPPAHQLSMAPWRSFILLGAGLFQFTPLKQACLRGCQSAVALLLVYYEETTLALARLGLKYALNCLGCCWALMLVMTAAGMTSIMLMMGLTLIMFIERQWRYGQAFSLCVGIGLVIIALFDLILFNSVP